MIDLKKNVYLKIGALIFITLLLLIPKSMITSLIHERESRQDRAISEVTTKWADSQTITGPVVSVPYYRHTKDSDGKITNTSKEYIHILPNNLEIVGELLPQKRHRGIFEIVVYNSKVNFKGTFTPIELSVLKVDPENILWNEAEFVVGIPDLRGIEQQVDLSWNNKSYSFNPGVSSSDIIQSGINTRIELDKSDSTTYAFNFDLELKGSQLLYFTPVGKVTDVKIKSNWANPSFNGSFLPDTSNVSDKGFYANWNVLHLNRNFPQRWIGSSYDIDNNSFGIDLILPIDNYQKSYRASNYAILFIGFTFIAFFFMEIMNRIFIHPIQYILVGISLIVFYTLLLSFSEHMMFNLAFWIAASATILLISLYCKAILKSTKLSLFIGGLLLVLYTFIFVIIQVQDYALLIGSVGLFIIIGFIMYFSRKIDWYNLNGDDSKSVIDSIKPPIPTSTEDEGREF